MIFVTVGGQGSFDRLVGAVDRWASTAPSPPEIFAQIGAGATPPEHLEWETSLTSERFAEFMQKADLIVSHAGMGTILTALDLGRPILVMPRRAEFSEHRNDHQVDTARRLAEVAHIPVAWSEEALLERLDDWRAIGRGEAPVSPARAQLIDTIREFLEASKSRPRARGRRS